MIAPIIDIFIKNDVPLNFIFKLNHELPTQYIKSSLLLRDINNNSMDDSPEKIHYSKNENLNYFC